ncbi:MFS transporter [Duganella sp. FT80W]|uniref:MFS transporter n=1 Tax=Duganella guangzhouensis TaxID=2666084 RepID=A0A6I2L6K1_9BURK|nr:MFS transporter [Duganella guangzhouensis]MRW93272.1 MFS transporter [Duganella guangzhouensis]
MDKRLLILALGMFALGTDSFVVAGVLPAISQSFNIDVGLAGQLTTAYAIAYALLSPTIAALAASVPRKKLMLSGLGVFVIANLATAVAPSFGLALLSRVFAGLGAAMYAPTATGTGAMIVQPEQRGKALTIIVAGLTAATALGSPMGTVIGGLGDWRWTMVFVSAIGLIAATGIALLLKHIPMPPKVSLRARVAPLSDKRVGLVLATTLLAMAGNFVIYTYFSVVFDRVLSSTALFGALLVLWGSGGTLTNLVLSRLLDKFGPRWVLVVMLSVLVVDMALLPWTSAQLWSSVLAIGVWGIAGWGIMGPQQYRLVGLAPTTAPVVLGLNTAATYLGVTAAGVLGAAGLHILGGHNLALFAVLLFALAAMTSELATRSIAGPDDAKTLGFSGP